MHNIIAIAIGAAVGANLRYAISVWATRHLGASFPYGTLMINLLGCLLIGLLLSLANARIQLSETTRLLLVTGLLGGFTTFSSFGYETYNLINSGNWLAAIIYASTSMIVGLIAVFVGVELGRMW
ncbi:fluoride efflux transporter CrcB [Candidatus Oscillochloris fontis]|uniref:fluoride efflux transporter CrcB n=1 Tax=Candidatus Oscillochloris fontis TaxID=2496868 RepID=UPI00101C45AC|nr:fluoride efflux transporter CrcB [Candidatus Oscillochloris fontis]